MTENNEPIYIVLLDFAGFDSVLDIPWSYNKDVAEEYIDFCNIGDYAKVKKISARKFEKLKTMDGVDVLEIREYLPGVFLTDNDIEYCNELADEHCADLLFKLKDVKDLIKCFKGKEVRELERAIKKFYNKEPKDFCPDYISAYSKEDIVCAKLDAKKFCRSAMRFFYHQMYEVVGA